MYRLYKDLRRRLGPPLWHDDQGVPRYDSFHPSLCGIYDSHVALLEIECQSCQQRFLVSASWDSQCDINRLMALSKPERALYVMGPGLPSAEDSGSFDFGDAPWHGEQQCAGTTMSTDVCRVVEFWSRDQFEWCRHPEYEFVYIPDGGEEVDHG